MKGLFLLFLLAAPAIILTFDSGARTFAVAQEDEGDDDLADVEGDGDVEESAVLDEGGEGDEKADDGKSGGSPDAATTILFTKPIVVPGSNLELPGGILVEFLVGFLNKGSQEMVLETLDASFRYPMDFNFFIQNFSTLAYERLVKPGHEATLAYSFIPSETFAGRPFGLSINLKYRDASGNQFYEGVYNETVNIVELEEGLDGETFFLYLFLGACGVLLLVVGQQFLVSVGKKRVGGGTKRPAVETGTSNPNDVDEDWIPDQMKSFNKSPNPRSPKAKPSPKSPKAKQQQQQSPRQRKAKRSAGSDD